MAVRYTSFQQRKATHVRRETQLRADVRAAEGFVQEIIPQGTVEAPEWPPKPVEGQVVVFDLDCWANPRRLAAAIGPFLVLCGICTQHPGQFTSWVDAEAAQRGHYQTHYETGETS